MLWALLLVTLYPMPYLISRSGLGMWFYDIHLVGVHFFLCYTAVWLISLLRWKVLQKIVFSLTMLVFGLHAVMMISCLLVVRVPLNEDLMAAVLATNVSETGEFIATYCNTKVMAALGALAVVLLIFAILCRKLRKYTMPQNACYLGALAYLVSGVLLVRKPFIFPKSTFAVIAVTAYEMHKSALHQLEHHNPKLMVTKGDRPPLIVWIVGESLTNHHCSLYGYDKPTNPMLQTKVDSGEVLLYTNVQSAETSTLKSFELMMSTYQRELPDSVKPYQCINFQDVARNAGYRTCWLSNQSKRGICDNGVTQYAMLCDTSVFIGNQYAGLARLSYDGKLIPVMRTMLNRTSGKSVFFVHLMGCHQEFKSRYPESFAYFKENDYADKPQAQRATLASYDNAVRYNDYVVNAMFNLVRQRDAIVVYAPDHGLDIYESYPDYFGHAKGDNPAGIKAARDIPFLIYMTPTFRQCHADIAQRASQSGDRPFDMENFIYLLMDLMQCDFAESPLVARKSLFVSISRR